MSRGGVSLGTTAATQFTDETVTAGANVTYSIVAVDRHGNAERGGDEGGDGAGRRGRTSGGLGCGGRGRIGGAAGSRSIC